jgi:aryl-alcohol dehydrogenase-like predicted oxidoreductase
VKLALGTAQFGMTYGLTNTTGRPEQAVVNQILSQAFSAGVTVLDTAKLYGDAECVLGSVLREKNPFKIVTKIPPFSRNEINQSAIDEIKLNLEHSFEQLQVDNLYAVLLHDATDLLGTKGDEIFKALALLKQTYDINKIGISAYSPEIADQIIERYPIDIVQIPLSIFDQRAKKSGLLARLKTKAIETHTRSAFLQGALLSDIKKLPPQFNKVNKQLLAFDKLSKETGLSKMALAFDFLKKQQSIDQIIVGVLNEQQLNECVFAFDQVIEEALDYTLFESQDLSIIDPRNWK